MPDGAKDLPEADIADVNESFHMPSRFSRLHSWCAGLHGGQLVMLLGASVLVAATLAVGGVASMLGGLSAHRSLVRATNYDSYSANREDTLPDRDLWELKVGQGLSANEALVYTALRPRGSTSPRLDEYTHLSQLAGRIARYLDKNPRDTLARDDLRYVQSKMQALPRPPSRFRQQQLADSARGLAAGLRREVRRGVGLAGTAWLLSALAVVLAWLALWSWLGARSTGQRLTPPQTL